MAGLLGIYPAYQSVSGLEYVEADTGLSGGAAPQTVGLNLNQIGGRIAPRNLLGGGDFSTNPWQRGTSFTGITSTPTYTADRWAAVGGASSSISVSSQATTALPRFSTALQFGRAQSNADTAAIKLCQVIESASAIRSQGLPLVLSFWVAAGANFSAAGGNLTVTVYGGTGTNDTLANMLSGSWSGQSTLYTGTVSVTNTTLSARTIVNNSGAGITVPATVTQLGVVLSYVPVGTAGANDWLQFVGLQLEHGYNPSPFEHEHPAYTLERCQRFCYNLAEPAAGIVVATGGTTAAANTQNYTIALPVQMIKAPTVTISAGSWKSCIGASAATATGLAANSSGSTVNQIGIVTTLTQSVALPADLRGGGGTGYIRASAEF